MKIIVCVKQVPDTETRIRLAPDGLGIVESEINWIVSPYDEFAIEEALKIKEAKGGEVILVSLGPERVLSALRNGLAMGADSAVHLKDPLFDKTDTLGTARALAAAVKTLAPFDLVLLGQQGVGGDNSQMGGLLAEILDLPQVMVAVKLDVGDGKAVVEREIEGAHETWETTLPAVVSAQKGLNEPRYASLDAAKLSPRVRVLAMELPPPRPPVRMVQGDPETQVKELLKLLHEEAKVI
jgi:electron transfer flavoprotein beta subunit